MVKSSYRTMLQIMNILLNTVASFIFSPQVAMEQNLEEENFPLVQILV